LYIYAETAFHHEGDKDYLLKLVDEAKKSGVHGIKFQVLTDLDSFASTQHSAYKDIKSWIFSIQDWRDVFRYASRLGLDIVFMPLDAQSFSLLNDFKVAFIEIHSVMFYDSEVLNKLEESDTPLIFGVGGRTLGEIEAIVERFSCRDITLMVGFQSFPTRLKDVDMRKIQFLENNYRQCKIGYADHSSYDDVMSIKSSEYAYILGARVFEKHITVSEGKERIDFQSAVGSEKIMEMIKALDYLNKILPDQKGKLSFKMTDQEREYRARQKMPVAKYRLKAGCVIRENDLIMKVIDQKNKIDEMNLLVNRVLVQEVQKDSPFSLEDLE